MKTRLRATSFAFCVLFKSVVFVVVAGSGCAAQQSPTVVEVEPRYREASSRMIESQLKAAGRDIEDERVLEAMRQVPRHLFVPSRLRDQAYDDTPLPIGFGQTISQPYIVAFMTEKLQPKPTDKVLEIGTGSGYQAAVLARLVKEVYTIEIIEELAEQAESTFSQMKIKNVHVKAGDGHQGWPEHAPFDAVIVTCAPNKIPPMLCDQLAEGGRMIIPVGRPHGSQQLILLEKQNGELKQRSVLPVRFVPMTGENK